MTREEAISKICVALDVTNANAALGLVRTLKGHAGFFKVGFELFANEGPDLVRTLVNEDIPVFLDLKFHDIPNTVAGAARTATRLGVSVFNVHASGGTDMMRAALEASRETASGLNIEPPTVVAVTVLTSISQKAFARINQMEIKVLDHVVHLAKMAQEVGLDGVVTSPQELPLLRRECGSDFIMITPGIRPAGSATDDQRRTMTPLEAMSKGADVMVIGRPIIAAVDPLSVAELIISKIMEC